MPQPNEMEDSEKRPTADKQTLEQPKDLTNARTSTSNEKHIAESNRTNASDGSLRKYVPNSQNQSIEIDFDGTAVSRGNKLTEKQALLAMANPIENKIPSPLEVISADRSLPEEKKSLSSVTSGYVESCQSFRKRDQRARKVRRGMLG